MAEASLYELHQAVRRGEVEEIKRLVAAKADVGAESKTGFTALHIAVCDPENDSVPKASIEALIKMKADINVTTEDGNTPLHCAAMRATCQDAKDALRALIKGKADLEAKNWGDGSASTGMTALHFAAIQADRDAVQILIEAKADVRAKNTGGKQPVDMAEELDKKDIIDILKASAANLEMKVSTKKGVGFYIRAATSFLTGVEAQKADGDRPAVEKKAPVDRLSISGLGDAINIAVAVAVQCEKDGLATINKIETNYPDMAQGRGCSHITIALDRK